MLTAEPEGIILTINANAGTERLQVPASRARVSVQGPDGPESAHLATKPPLPKWASLPARVVIERSPKAGWRTVIADISSAVRANFPAGAKTTIRFYLPAVHSEQYDAQLRKKGIGKKVWVLGAAAYAKDTLMWNPREPVTILDINRVAGPVQEGAANPVWSGEEGWHGGSFLTSGYLRVKIRTPKHPSAVQRMMMNVNEADGRNLHRLSSPAEAYIDFADGWHLERATRVNSPEAALRNETKRIRAAFEKRTIVQGMPRTLVAFLLGDPYPYEPMAKVWKQRTWDWPGMTPFGYAVWFDSKGRVKSFGSYGELP